MLCVDTHSISNIHLNMTSSLLSAMEIHSLANSPLKSHSFNADRSQVAVCSNTKEVQLFARSGKDFVRGETLQKHEKSVTCVDWAPHTNRIVTCSQDSNAFVWNYVQDSETGAMVWNPTLVTLGLNRSATVVKWSPTETKFAVGSGANTVAICSYSDEENWWNAKNLKRPGSSTILALAWHPNSVLLATGSVDSRARVLSAYIKGDEKPPSTVWWGTRLQFNTLCAEYTTPVSGWVHSVDFSPSGDALAFTGHDSTITVVYPNGEGQPPKATHVVRMPFLPLVTLTFTSEDTIIAAGHDCEPFKFNGDESNGWKVTKSLDASSSSSSAGGSFKGSAFNMLKAANSGAEAERPTIHQNPITSINPYSGAPGQVSQVSTTGTDGKLVIWQI